MTKTVSRVSRLAALVTASLMLAGCGSGPSEIGSAAIIGNTAISVDTVQQRANAYVDATPDRRAVLRQQAQFDDLGRALASALVSRELTRQVAELEQLKYREEDVADLIEGVGGIEAAAEQGIDTQGTFAEQAKYQLLSKAIGEKYLNKLTVTVDIALAMTRSQAQRKAEKMAESKQSASNVVRQDNAQQEGSAEQNRQFSAVATMQIFGWPGLALFTAQPGSVVAFSVGQGQETGGGQWVVARINERSTAGQALDATGQAVTTDKVKTADVELIGQAVVSYRAQEIGARISPRYGVWNPGNVQAYLRIAPNSQETTAIVLPAKPDRGQ